MDVIGKEFMDISADMWDYTSSVAHGKSARKVEKRRKEVLGSIQDAQKRINKMPDFEGDKSYRDSVLSFLTLDYNVLNNDYSKIVDMEEVAEQSYDAMEAYLTAQEMAGAKLEAAGKMMNAQERVFAGLHNVKINESKDQTSKKLEAASKVFKYYNRIYLIFFKSNKQEAYLLDALKRNDVNAVKQNMDALAKASVDGLLRIDSVKAFNGNLSLKMTVKECLTFYKTESTTKAQPIINFSVKKESFEKIKAAFGSKSESSRTKADVDEYNKAISEFNKAVNEANAINQEMDNKRTALINKWNQNVTAFMDKEVPKK